MSKKITKNLDARLAKYTAAAGAIVGVTAVNAQVVYTDVDPDATVTGAGVGVNLDIDGDGTNDFTVATVDGSNAGTYYGYSYVFNYAGALFNNLGANNWLGSNQDVSALSAGAAISSTQPWSAGVGSGTGFLHLNRTTSWPNSTQYNNAATDGVWSGAMDKYVGLKFDISGATHYGWVRLDVAADGSSVTVKDYAYNSTADASLNAGETGNGFAGITEDIAGAINVYGSVDKIVVENSSNGTNGRIEVLNLAGELIKTVTLNSTREVVDASDLSTGIYLVNVAFDETVVTKKVYLR